MNTGVTSKMGRRRGARNEHTLNGSVSDEQRSRRPIFDVTLRADALLNGFFVASRSRIHSDTLPRRSANPSKISLSVGVHSFSTGCKLTAIPESRWFYSTPGWQFSGPWHRAR